MFSGCSAELGFRRHYLRLEMQTDLEQLIASLPSSAVSRASRLALVVLPNLADATRQDLLAKLAHIARSASAERHTVTAWLGDSLASGPTLRHGQISTLAAISGIDSGTLRNAKLVCRRIPPSRRHDNLTWSHHCEVALAFDNPTEVEKWLAVAEREKLGTRELRRRIRAHRASVSRTPTTSDNAAAFRLLRELRSAARATQQQQSVWRHWSPTATQHALEELLPLAAFIDELRRQARNVDTADNTSGLQSVFTGNN